MKPFRVQFDIGATTHDVVVRARTHDEAYEEALQVVGVSRMTVDNAIVTPQAGKWTK